MQVSHISDDPNGVYLLVIEKIELIRRRVFPHE